VTEFVQQHAQEQEHDEQQAAPGDLRSAGKIVHAENPGEEEQEGRMDADRRAGDRSYGKAPGHGILLATGLLLIVEAAVRRWRAGGQFRPTGRCPLGGDGYGF